ncbi:molybdopterin-dependent oxidoreductase [Bradyrhizobium sp. CB1650]|uniref:molybdopterin-dependent oxidoreductase n=1 Tax=Bradyrhizobium sp. CB1650 TaxID=3039153 RepID=UPI002435FEBE|nr:molybdopterin-dependent oxidoreductase [Bradyrhizobium sp. CB1650]WGD50212.1 molybdopterin-dependent oxidoreductase [Bradyrhizobium sp. CB1650]
MPQHRIHARSHLSRRAVLRTIGIAGLAVASQSAWADQSVELPIAGEPRQRPVTHDFPQKGSMILQRIRPPLLETPMEVFDRGVFTPNDQFYVRWHWAVIPTKVDADAFRLAVRGHVNQALSLSISDLLSMPRVELAAVNQCSGNSRGLFSPRVPGAQWAHGAMGNARWTGVLLKDVLDRAGVKLGAVQVRFNGLDEPVVPEAPDFRKSLDVDHARDGEVMIAFAMNGEQLPLLNGFPLRLIVPGWYSTYWVKMLSDIEVLDRADDDYWMTTAYTIPDTPHANIAPGQTGVKMVPISRMVPRSFFTNVTDGASLPAGAGAAIRGIAFGGDAGVARVELSMDDGRTWQPVTLDEDYGKYSFRRWQTSIPQLTKGSHSLMVRCTNLSGDVQTAMPNWNNSGFMRNVIETVHVTAI